MQGTSETGRSLASKLKHQFMYALIFVGGRTLAYAFLYIVVLVYSLMPSVSARSRAYIARRFSPRSKWQFFKYTYRLNLTFGRTLIDRAALGILGQTGVSSTEEERNLCRHLLAEGKGLILLTAHAGCWQMAVNLATFINAPLNVVYYRNPKDNDKTVAQHGHRFAHLNQINPAGPLGGVPEMMVALQKGEVLCAMADRVFGAEKNAVGVNFLGGKIQVPYSFYRLAAATGAPVVVQFFPWEKRGRFATQTVKVLRIPELGPKKENYVLYAQQFVDELEKFCIKYPYQFFNYFNLWSNYAEDD